MYKLSNKREVSYKLTNKITLTDVATKIANKAIKLLYSKNANKMLQNVLEFKDNYTKEDLIQETLLQMLEDKVNVIDYIIYVNSFNNVYLHNKIRNKLNKSYTAVRTYIYKNIEKSSNNVSINEDNGTLEDASIHNFLVYNIEKEETKNKTEILKDLNLTKKQLQILQMSFVEKLTNVQIAETLNISAGTVKKTIWEIRNTKKSKKVLQKLA